MAAPEQLPWIGVDLDGTLAECHGWRPDIGKPVPAMMNRVYAWLHKPGIRVKIFTARVALGDAEVAKVKVWLTANALPDLEVTNVKDMYMLEMWDDRAIQVIPNTGIAVTVALRL